MQPPPRRHGIYFGWYILFGSQPLGPALQIPALPKFTPPPALSKFQKYLWIQDFLTDSDKYWYE